MTVMTATLNGQDQMTSLVPLEVAMVVVVVAATTVVATATAAVTTAAGVFVCVVQLVNNVSC
jgi:hypothetical protein